ncbi:MAG: phosphotransferase family protein [Rhodocyclaceae bacterium]|nr:phosphotransferase family protein [Rhodocyclaceae bacterium]
MSAQDLKLIDMAKLSRWLDQHAPQLGDGPLKAEWVSGGSTNVVIALDRGGPRTVLRSPPLAGSPQGLKTIEREATVLRALKGTSVPHPKFHIYCADPDVIGVPFYIMEMVDGWAANMSEHDNQMHFPPGFDQGPDQHYLGYAMIDGLIEMANVDYKAIGLESFGKPEGFLGRQVDRWLGQLATYPQRYSQYQPRQLEGMDYVVDWLRANVPETSRPGLLHADYAMNNVLFAHRPPARLVAIIDWEMATIGDPVIDLAGFAMHLRGDDPNDVLWPYFDPERFPRRADALAYYAEKTGRDVSCIDYYIVLYRFRMACILEYKVAEAIQGLAPKAKGERFDGIVRRLMASACERARSLG